MKKWMMILLSVTIIWTIWIVASQHIARKAIDDYIIEQGIDKEDIVVEDFQKDWHMGGYVYFLSVKDEDPGIYYLYSYRGGDVIFKASRMPEDVIKEKIWGGYFVDSSEYNLLKYPPIKE